MFQKPKRQVTRVFVHCSASDLPQHDDVSVMRKWHTDPPPAGNGWSDVGYHFFIKKDGTVQSGRPLEVTPAAQAGNNTGTIAICLHGLVKTKFTEAQRTSLVKLCGEIDDAYGPGKVTFHGHCEVAAKACPVIDYVAWLSLDSFGRMVRTTEPATSLTTTEKKECQPFEPLPPIPPSAYSPSSSVSLPLQESLPTQPSAATQYSQLKSSTFPPSSVKSFWQSALSLLRSLLGRQGG